MTQLLHDTTPDSAPHAVLMSDYRYDLPPERIALSPLKERDQSKLMLADAASDMIGHYRFFQLPELLPPDTLLIRNRTRVIAARLVLHKLTGGRVEILCTDPVSPSSQPGDALLSLGVCRWNCLIGGKKITEGTTLSLVGMTTYFNDERPLFLSAKIIEKHGSEAVVEFEWTPESLPFAAVLDAVGKIPLPPYIKRDTTSDDAIRYQTVYGTEEGSVAAPTAGLHFTQRTFESLFQKGIHIADLTLHVGLGTFKPIESDNVALHHMHREKVAIPKSTVEALLNFYGRPLSQDHRLCAIGTTSARTLESLYWFGVKLIHERPSVYRELKLGQWEAYHLAALFSSPILPAAAFDAAYEWMVKHHLEQITGETQLIIVPPYRFQSINALITNFHQPESTLMLMIASFLGGNRWRRIYDEALSRDYRFLSYGDASLLFH